MGVFKAADFAAGSDMIYQITHNFTFDIWSAFYANYKGVLAMILLAFALHSIPDDFIDKLLERFHRVPMIAYIAFFFLFVFLYGLFKSSEQVMPIYLRF